MRQILRIFIYCWFLTGCGEPIDLEEDYSLSPEILLASSECNSPDCLSFKTERYKVNESTYTPLDILFILDVSRSMEDNLEKISKAASSLMSYIEHLNWQIVFTTTDHGDSQYYCTEGQIQTRVFQNGRTQKFCPKEHRIFPQPADSWKNYKESEPKFGNFMPLQKGQQILNQKILNPQVQNYQAVFRDTISRNSYEKSSPCQWPPYCQNDHEQPLRVLKSIIERTSAYPSQSFIRKPAVLMAFIMTDEEERAEDPQNATTAAEVLQVFNSNFPNKKIIVHGISITNSSCLEEQDTVEVNYSKQLNQLVKFTQGESISICQDSYKSAFSGISKQTQKYINKIPLEFTPVVTENTPIQVKVFDSSGKPIKTKWKTKGNFIFFDKTLPPDARVEVSYYYNKTP